MKLLFLNINTYFVTKLDTVNSYFNKITGVWFTGYKLLQKSKQSLQKSEQERRKAILFYLRVVDETSCSSYLSEVDRSFWSFW